MSDAYVAKAGGKIYAATGADALAYIHLLEAATIDPSNVRFETDDPGQQAKTFAAARSSMLAK